MQLEKDLGSCRKQALEADEKNKEAEKKFNNLTRELNGDSDELAALRKATADLENRIQANRHKITKAYTEVDKTHNNCRRLAALISTIQAELAHVNGKKKHFYILLLVFSQILLFLSRGGYSLYFWLELFNQRNWFGDISPASNID